MRGKIWFTETGGWILRRKYDDGKIARVPVLAAQGGARDAARSAPGMPEPAHPARVPLQLAGAEVCAAVHDDLGFRLGRPVRSAAPGL